MDNPTDPDGDGIPNNNGNDTSPGGYGGLPAPVEHLLGGEEGADAAESAESAARVASGKSGKLVLMEDQAVGSVNLSVYGQYFRYCGVLQVRNSLRRPSPCRLWLCLAGRPAAGD